MGAVPSGAGRHARQALLPWQLVRVSGPSMVPTLRPGEWAFVRRSVRVDAGDVVMATFDALPGVVVVKRVRTVVDDEALRDPDGATWAPAGRQRAELRSDNDAAGGDSRSYGPGRILGRVILVGRGRRWRRPARL